MYKFDAAVNTEKCIGWIRNWFEENGKGCTAVLGLSGGKDSTITAALLAKALGPDRVIGVAMPDEGQSLNEADEIAKYLGIRYFNISVAQACRATREALSAAGIELSAQCVQNIPPRERMKVLFAVAQCTNGRPVNTCNLSEDYIGYATLFGDAAGSFSVLGMMTVTEVLEVGDYLGLPSRWVHKTPDDGLPNSSPDEIKLGFTYAELDRYIREGIEPAPEKKEKIDRLNRINRFKTEILRLPVYMPEIEA